MPGCFCIQSGSLYHYESGADGGDTWPQTRLAAWPPESPDADRL
ncbi:unnamed protein product [Linum tenue]|uniref:Uncharacterized protein n=1 Tax=Linum tenue TaxID=586396 RepID=A0AAV0QJJ9_9ROSI|nr:unnamed protein product [Linum tenue]